jgi:hypothetical protein
MPFHIVRLQRTGRSGLSSAGVEGKPRLATGVVNDYIISLFEAAPKSIAKMLAST